MKRIHTVLLFVIFSGLVFISCNRSDKPLLVMLGTTDVHGTFFPYDFIDNTIAPYSLSSVSEYVNTVRADGTVTLLLDNGDLLQGQPEVYFFNYIDTVSPHLCAEILNYMKYDAATVGNHDIEAGHPVYDRLGKQYKFPLLAANAVLEENGNPYFKPYTIIRKAGLKVAVIGLITPSVPGWLPPVLYSGMKFTNMTDAAAFWMEEVKKHKPDLVVGLFHSGWNDDSEHPLPGNSSDAVAFNVPGFDVVFAGHDHASMNRWVVNNAGDSVLVLNAGSKAAYIARVDVFRQGSRIIAGQKKYRLEGSLIETTGVSPDSGFTARFARQYEQVLSFVSRVIGNAPEKISSRDALFGPSPFTDMIHTIQLDLTGADISFAAPLSFDVSIGPGDITVADMFKLYKYENMLYTMKMTGREIDGFLESSAADWFATMTSDNDYLLEYRKGSDGKPLVQNGKARLRAPVYSFDSAAGIEYTVDVTRKKGDRVEIKSLTDGHPFYNDSIYLVAINSYRASGGGGHIRRGAGLSAEEALERLVVSTEKDLRFYMIQWIEVNKVLKPHAYVNWRVLPANYADKAKKREWPLLYGDNNYQVK